MKRAGSIFATMSVAHVDGDLDTPGEFYQKVFSNGDMYTGQWADNCDNGHGKYLWADGCMYVGEWIRGKANGKGKFSWPSGATYEGQFKNGCMDGEGTYTGSSNDTYRGVWVMNMQHGRGTKNYANGDHYEGDWRRGWPDGQGRYQWHSGNQYFRRWRNGKMNGNGTMIWANGNRYDGCWQDGLPKCNGTYRWIDGSFYVGVWSQDPKEMSGTYYPSTSQNGQFDWDPREVFLNDLSDCNLNENEKISIFPSQKMVSWPCEGDFLQKQTIGKNPKARRASADERLSSGDCSWGSEIDLGSDSNGNLGPEREGEESSERLQSDDLGKTGGIRHHHIRIQPTKRQGVTIMNGHRNYMSSC